MGRSASVLLGIVLLELCLTRAVCAQTWLNETNAEAEADFANLQYPASLGLQAGQSTGLIYGALFEAGVTELLGAPANVLADVGYGPAASDPRTSGAWSWFPGTYDSQVSGNDQFYASFTAPAAGSYSYSYRFSLDNGASWTLGDLDGAGSSAGLNFNVTQLGAMTVTAPPVLAADFVRTLGPATLNLTAGQSTGLIHGQIFEPGVTPALGEPGSVTANLGFGPAGSDPRTSSLWTWNGANYEAQVGSDDAYFGAFAAPAENGIYHYTMRFSLDNGSTWTVADLDGNGTIAGNSFSAAQLGVLTVTGGVNPPFHAADFSRNRFVDAADMAKWRTAFGPGSGADADGDGDSDGDDLLRWQRALGTYTSTAAGAPVPEPAGAGLAMIAILVGAVGRRR